MTDVDGGIHIFSLEIRASPRDDREFIPLAHRSSPLKDNPSEEQKTCLGAPSVHTRCVLREGSDILPEAYAHLDLLCLADSSKLPELAS